MFAMRNDSHLPPARPVGDGLKLVKRMTETDYQVATPEPAPATPSLPPMDDLALASWCKNQLNRLADENKIALDPYMPEGAARPRLRVNELVARTVYEERELP